MSSTVLPALVLPSPDSERREEKPHAPAEALGPTTATSRSRGSTPSTASSRVKPSLSAEKLPTAHGSTKPTKPTKSNDKTNHGSSHPPTSLVPRSNNATTPNNPKPFHCKLNALQISSLLKPFWNDLLQNQLKAVRKTLHENHLRVIDFDSSLVRYAPNANGSPLHLCAQFGFLAMAKMLVNEFHLGTNHRNKVGSTPLHAACKSGHAAIVSWLLDELHVPLDVPDAQHRTALDVAPYDIVDKCVLTPLRSQYALLKQTEEELMGLNATAQEELLSAQLQFRRSAMVLTDSEAHVDEARARIEAVSLIDRHWYEQLQSKHEALAVSETEYDRLQQILEEEQANAHVLFDREVRSGQEQHSAAKEELLALQALVETTQQELDRRTQLLVDQVGVFDAALVEFPGSKDVQQWALATLLAIADTPSGGDYDRELLLLRAEPVEVVRHVLTAFPSDYGLQYEAVRLLVAVQRIHAAQSTSTINVETVPLFVKAIVDSDLLLLLGECVGRWFEADQAKAESRKRGSSPSICCEVWEAMYLCLRLPRNAQRALAFCQKRHLQLLPLRAFENCQPPPEQCFISLVLLTQVQFGVKKPLLTTGVVRIVFEWLSMTTEDASTQEHDRTATMEAAQNLFACLALLTSSPAAQRRAKHAEPRTLEELTPDCESITAHGVVECLSRFVKHADDAVGVVMWASRLLVNLADHGGPTARRVREELLGVDGLGCYPVVAECLRLVLQADDGWQAVQATLDLIQRVWIDRYDHEGQLLSTHRDVLTSLADNATVYTAKLLIHVKNLPCIVDGLQALSRAAANPRNAEELAKLEVPIESSILQPILQFIIHQVQETRSSYREPVLVQLLLHLLKLFLYLSHTRLKSTQACDLAALTRDLHTKSREIGVCTVLKAFKTDHHTQEPLSQRDPNDWLALKALCMQIVARIHCAC